MNSTLAKHDDGTIDLTITIPTAKVEEAFKKVLDATVKSATMPGFRKGKAPKKMVEEQVDNAKVREEVLRDLLPEAYIESVKEHNIKPIINPKIHVQKIDDGKDWVITAKTAEAPTIDLNGYKDAVGKVTAKSKIIVPGKEPTPPSMDEVMDALVKSVKITVPSLLIEREVDRLLSQLLNEVKSLGLSLDQYLSSTGKTPEQLRDEYVLKATTDITVEFSLQEIAEKEKITVEEKEIDEAIRKAKDEVEKKHLEANRYLLASILRQQKVLDFLRNL